MNDENKIEPCDDGAIAFSEEQLQYLNSWKEERENDDDVDYENMTLTTLQASDIAITAVEPPPMNCLTIHNSQSEMIVNIDPEGNVEFGENYTPEEAAEVFWTSLGMNSPMQLQKQIDELRKCLPFVSAETIKFDSDKETITEDFIFPKHGTGRGSHVETLPGSPDMGMLEDLEYFRNKIHEAMSIGHPTEKLEKQLTTLENIRDGGWDDSIPTEGVRFGNIHPHDSVYYEQNSKNAFEKAMEIVE